MKLRHSRSVNISWLEIWIYFRYDQNKPSNLFLQRLHIDLLDLTRHNAVSYVIDNCAYYHYTSAQTRWSRGDVQQGCATFLRTNHIWRRHGQHLGSYCLLVSYRPTIILYISYTFLPIWIWGHSWDYNEYRWEIRNSFKKSREVGRKLSKSINQTGNTLVTLKKGNIIHEYLKFILSPYKLEMSCFDCGQRLAKCHALFASQDFLVSTLD